MIRYIVLLEKYTFLRYKCSKAIIIYYQYHPKNIDKSKLHQINVKNNQNRLKFLKRYKIF